jgi:hypothetical protein
MLQISDPKAEHSLALSRRQVLASTAHAVTGAVAGATAFVAVYESFAKLAQVTSDYPALSEHKGKEGGQEKHPAYPYTDQLIKVADASVRNLGVEHTGNKLREHGAFLASAIRECDILLLEGTPLRVYFNKLAAYGRSTAKEVRHVESEQRLGLSELYAHASYLGALVGSMVNIDLAKRGDDASLVKRSLAIGATGMTTCSGLPSIPVLASEITGNVELLHLDPAPITAGRSCLMLEALYKSAHENPGKKILLVTGDLHARFIERLLHKGEDSWEYRMKLAAYKAILPS